MGRGKPFIHKRSATTYSLTCEDRTQEQPSHQPDPSHERTRSCSSGAWTTGVCDTSGIGLSEQERQEVLDLGLPDDGYNYLQHIREPAGHIDVTDDGGAGSGAPGFDGVQASAPAHSPLQPRRVTSIQYAALLVQALKYSFLPPTSSLHQRTSSCSMPGACLCSKQRQTRWGPVQERAFLLLHASVRVECYSVCTAGSASLLQQRDSLFTRAGGTAAPQT